MSDAILVCRGKTPLISAARTMTQAGWRSVLVVDVHTVYFQCSRALLRSKLWDPATQVPRTALPSRVPSSTYQSSSEKTAVKPITNRRYLG